MVDLLSEASVRSSDPLAEAPLVAAVKWQSGGSGRPKTVIERTFLQQALRLRGFTGVADALQCSARTVRRRALELGLVEAGQAVMEKAVRPDGATVYVRIPREPPSSVLTDEALDSLVREILHVK